MEVTEIVETPQAETPDTPQTTAPETPKVSERFSFLAKKEQNIQRQRQELKAQLQAFESQKAEVERLKQEIESSKSKASSYKTNPLSLLEEHGLTYKELTDYILNNNTVSTDSQIKALNDKIEQYEKQRELDRLAESKRQEEERAQREAQVITEFKNEIHNFINSKKDTYELTALYDSSDLVYDTVEAYFEKTQKVLSIPEACDLVEKYLEQQVEKSLKTKKLSQRIPQKEPIETPQPSSSPRKTISNTQYTASTPNFVSPKVENDRMARALKALDL